jgi:hypothetical protein
MAATIEKELIPRLRADVLAQFEWVSGLMIVNITHGELSAAAGQLAAPHDGKREVFAAINHETYHFFQVIGTGYCFAHMDEMRRLVRRIVRQDRLRELRHAPRRLGMRAANRLVGRTEAGERMLGWLTVGRELEVLRQLRAAAPMNDPSLATARAPQLLASLDDHGARLRVPGRDGLCVLDLIECGAFVYQYSLTYAGNEWRARLSAAWPDFEETYRRAYEVAEERCGARALDILLLALAPTLCYEHPVAAYGEVLSRVAQAAPGQELAAARVLARHPFEVPTAGRYLGTAADVWARRRVGSGHIEVYDGVLRQLRRRAWGVDELDLLADPQAAAKVPSFPLGLVTADGRVVGLRDDARLSARLRLGKIVLKQESLERVGRDVEQRAVKHILRGAHLWLGPTTPATRAFQQGVRRTEDVRITEACDAFREAIDTGDPDTVQLAAYNLGIL